jgi:flagellar biogenesis protein FliO
MDNRSKKIALLCLLLIVSGGWIALASRNGGLGSARPEAPGASPLQSSASRLAWNDPSPPDGPGLDLGKGELFLRMMLSVGLVIGLGGIALYLSKRTLPRVVHAGGKEIHVLETAYLGPRKALHLVEVGSQRLLIASTHDRITMLAPLNETWIEMPKPELEEAGKA